jgi:hypothetical protein
MLRATGKRQFLVGGLDGGRQRAGLVGGVEGCAGAAGVLPQGVGDQLSQGGKGQGFLVATTAVVEEQGL